MAEDVPNGFLLLSDLGSTTYLQRLTVDNAPFMYSDAVDALIKFQLHSEPGKLPEYDRAFIERELNLFPEWFIGKHLGITMTEAQQAQLNGVFDAIISNVLAQQQVFMHRDFHSRNLMFLEQHNPGVLDFQDAVFGPVTYDLASLLRGRLRPVGRRNRTRLGGALLAARQAGRAAGQSGHRFLLPRFRIHGAAAPPENPRHFLPPELPRRQGQLPGRPADRERLRAQDLQPLHGPQAAGAPARRVRGQGAAGRLHLLIIGPR
ncbi:phosphotransferase [Massilia sp. H-1]|nr:phosphotransferase [Massilia sp. H-1]